MNKFFSAVVRTVITPVTIAADIVTLGGALTDKKETYTGENLRKVAEDLDDSLS